MQISLETGKLNKYFDGGRQELEYVMTVLGEQHLTQIMALQKLIVQNLTQPDLMEAISYSFMKEHIERQGFILGVFVEQRLIAFRIVYYPHSQDKEFNMGIDIGLPEDQRHKVANLQMVCVHPNFRGNALASMLNRISLRLLREQHPYVHIFATVSPYNVCNVRILLNSGFRITRLKMKYGGKLRYIVYQNLHAPLEFIDDDAVYARLDDLDTQREIFRSGRYGVALAQMLNLDSTLKKDLLSRSHIIFKRPSDQQVVHVVKRRQHAAKDSQAIGAASWLPGAWPAVQWNIAGDQSVSVGGSFMPDSPDL